MNSCKLLYSCLVIGAILILNSCDQTLSIQDNTPPPNSQTLETATLAKTTEKEPELVPGRYIVVYKDQNDRKISEQAAQGAVQRTEAIFSELNIQQDSLIHQYKYALKGFAANLTEEQVEQLKKDPRVDAVVQE